ncbi:ATP-dependent helicase HrpB [Thalassotalea agarivorans]|uniref:ATP-dependent helicase HrpB n=1 Tax=Thalassotalea agarivorans TaxID=349064 RepID=A0A1I0GMT7_THASX|nr:ATP-dependent helicase HrpB [Thalassotalea agarivorans]SET72300.1 ATP-dependent helicase HrpB [Thalassotalea agarivorans]
MYPISEIQQPFIDAILQHDTVVLTAPPGAGKSTVLPLWLLDIDAFKGKKIYLLQPRRIAAKMIALYLASQLQEEVGQRVGYRLKHDVCVSKHTQLEVITEGILTQIMQSDPEMNDCAMILLDEFHERSVHADLAFAIARDIQQGFNESLKLVLMSATLDVEYLQSALPDAVFLHSQGKSFPVDIHYAPANALDWQLHATKEIKRALTQYQGSILVFLPGVKDINFIARQLSESQHEDVKVVALHGSLTPQQQQLAIAHQTGQRKVVLSTNIAETSLTIEGIRIVIDAGFEKAAKYDPNVRSNRLVVQQIAKSSATQRAGRAGRLSEGVCIRLYDKEAYARRPAQHESEILRTDLLPVVLEAARWGVTALSQLPLLTLPVLVTENLAWQELKQLKIVDDNRKLTAHGDSVAAFPTSPRFAHMLIGGKSIEQKHEIHGLAYLACILVSLLEEKDILSGDQGRNQTDINRRVMLWRDAPKRFEHIGRQVTRLSRALNVKKVDSLPLEYSGCLLALAFPENIAKQTQSEGRYLTYDGKGVVVPVQDELSFEEVIVYASSYTIKHQNLVRMAARASLTQLKALDIIAPEDVDTVYFDERKQAVIAQRQTVIGRIVLDSKPIKETLTAEQISDMWRTFIEKKGLGCLNWQAADQLFLAKLRWLNRHQSHLELPSFDEQALLSKLDDWLVPFVGDIVSLKKLKQLDLKAQLLSLLTYQQQQLLTKVAPSHYVGPTGRKCPIRYGEEKSPILSVPMQELYGQENTPEVGDSSAGKGIAVLLEIVSPAGRPIQLTQDLARFWAGSYSEVQKDMKAKYPKHFWPDNPAQAKPTIKTKRRM